MDNEYGLIEVDEKDIPDIVASQFSQIQVLGDKVDEALSMAEHAKETVDIAQKQAPKFGKKKAAIESLQNAAVDLAQSQISAAEAQKVSFEYQQQLGKIARYLFELGCSNMAANRSVVRQLEIKLKGASEEELSELARQEVEDVIKQLKAQEDLLKKQEKLSYKVRDHEYRFIEGETKDKEQDSLLQESMERDVTQDEQISKLEERIRELENTITNWKHNRLMGIVAFMLSIAGVILGILHFII